MDVFSHNNMDAIDQIHELEKLLEPKLYLIAGDDEDARAVDRASEFVSAQRFSAEPGSAEDPEVVLNKAKEIRDRLVNVARKYAVDVPDDITSN